MENYTFTSKINNEEYEIEVKNIATSDEIENAVAIIADSAFYNGTYAPYFTRLCHWMMILRVYTNAEKLGILNHDFIEATFFNSEFKENVKNGINAEQYAMFEQCVNEKITYLMSRNPFEGIAKKIDEIMKKIEESITPELAEQIKGMLNKEE